MLKEMNVPFLGEIPIDPNIVLTMDEGSLLSGKSNNGFAEKRFDAIVCKIIDNMSVKIIVRLIIRI